MASGGSEEPSEGKPAPWGGEEPLVWCARQARRQVIWGSLGIAILLVVYGVAHYVFFTKAVEEDVEHRGSLVVVVISPFVLSVYGAIAAGALARTARRQGKLEGVATGNRIAIPLLLGSTILWAFLWLAFLVSLTIVIDKDFPIGLFRDLPVYLGLCIAVYATGAGMMVWSERNRLEAGLSIALGLGALLVFLLFPFLIDPDIDEVRELDVLIFWIRTGLLMASILPCLIVATLWHSHGRAVALVEDDILKARPLAEGAPVDVAPITTGSTCEQCGGELTIHPRTQEVFCPACGWGLAPEGDGPA